MKILIDNGHNTPGKRSPDGKFLEAICNCEISKRIISKLLTNVILISIHVNAAGNGTKWMNATGWSCYTCKGQTNI